MRELGRPFRPPVAVAVAIRLAISATRVAQAVLVAQVLGHVLHGSGRVGPALGLAAALGAARLVLVWTSDLQATTASGRVRAVLRARLYRHLTELGPGYLVRHRTGGVESVLVEGVERLGSYYGEFVPLALASIVSVVGVLVWVAVLDPITAGVMVVAALLVPVAPVLTARAFGETGRQFSEGLGRLASEHLDAIQGLVTLNAFNAAGRWGRRLTHDSEELAADATSLGGLASIHVGFVSLGMAGGTVLGVALGTLRVTHHAVAGSALLAILLLARECFRPLGDLQAAFPSAYDAVARANSVFDLLEAVPGAPAPVAPGPLDPGPLGEAPVAPGPLGEAMLDNRSLEPSVQFEEVTFAYRDDRAPALDGVSFKVSPGETVALVGPSGAGKTTVVSLLLRFFDPTSGTVRVGGHDIRTLGPGQLRSLIAVTFQDSYLFHRSIAENLSLARPRASAADMQAAARAANAHDFITALPDGYDTVVDERGASLSGGERQRLTIARALLADSPILVLDEPTSSVDALSESLITEALGRLTAERTIIVIAHRLSTVVRADRVIVLDNGRVVEAGRPDDLRDRGGAFARLVDAQELLS